MSFSDLDATEHGDNLTGTPTNMNFLQAAILKYADTMHAVKPLVEGYMPGEPKFPFGNYPSPAAQHAQQPTRTSHWPSAAQVNQGACPSPAPQRPAPQAPAPQRPAPQAPAPQRPAPQAPAPQAPAPQAPAPAAARPVPTPKAAPPPPSNSVIPAPPPSPHHRPIHPTAAVHAESVAHPGNAVANDPLEKLQSDLNSAISEYTNIFRLYSEAVLKNNQFLQNNSGILNSIVKDASAAIPTYYYINNFGFAHKYDVSGLQLNHSSCPRVPVQTASPFLVNDASLSAMTPTHVISMTQFANYSGPNMVTGQMCGLSGMNIWAKNPTTGIEEYAWVDIKGVRHMYPANIWKDLRNTSCLSAAVGEPTEVPYDQFNRLPIDTATPMTPSSVCYKQNVDDQSYKKMLELNTRINDLTKKIVDAKKAPPPPPPVRRTHDSDVVMKAVVSKNGEAVSCNNVHLDDFIPKENRMIYFLVIGTLLLLGIILIVNTLFGAVFGSGSNGTADAGNGSGGSSLLGIILFALVIIFIVYYVSKRSQLSKAARPTTAGGRQ